jgi:hypothetical protein
MPHLPFITVQCLACGQPAEPGFHFCAAHLRLTWSNDAPLAVRVEREPEESVPVPVSVIECHPSHEPLMSAAGYRLAFTGFDPDTFQPAYCFRPS